MPKKIDLILKEDFSLPRNPIIAKIFRFVKLAEDMGTGFHKMINGWSKFYKIPPKIIGDFDYYKITFPTTIKTTTKTTIKTTTKNEGKEKQILDLIKGNPHLTAEELAKQIELSKEGVLMSDNYFSRF